MVKPTSELQSVTKGYRYTSLNIKPDTRTRLVKHLKVMETMDEVLNRVLDKFEEVKPSETNQNPVA